MVVAGAVAVISLRGGASVVFLIGTILRLLNSLVWTLFPLVQRSGGWVPESDLFMGMRIFGTFAWLVTAAGALLVVFTAVGLRRQNQALEAIVAGSQTDRVA